MTERQSKRKTATSLLDFSTSQILHIRRKDQSVFKLDLGLIYQFGSPVFIGRLLISFHLSLYNQLLNLRISGPLFCETCKKILQGVTHHPQYNSFLTGQITSFALPTIIRERSFILNVQVQEHTQRNVTPAQAWEYVRCWDLLCQWPISAV